MELSKDTILLQNEIRKFCQQVIAEKVDEFDKNGIFPLANIKKLAQMGIMGAVISENFGGAALDTIGLVIALEEISKVCASTALIIATHNVLFAYPILKFGSEEMKKNYLPKAAAGEIVGGFAEVGTNEIVLKKENDNYLLTGRNPMLLNCAGNGPFIVLLPNTQNGHAFLFDAHHPGINRQQKSNVMGMNAAGIGDLVFENCRATNNNIMGNGSTIFEETQNLATLGFAAIALGISQAAIDASIKYAKERIQFGCPIVNFGMIREKIANMTTKLEAARLLIYDAAQQRNRQADFRRTASIAKYFATQACVEITTNAIQIYGGYGYMKDYPIERYFRDGQVINVLCSTPIQEQENIAKLTVS